MRIRLERNIAQRWCCEYHSDGWFVPRKSRIGGNRVQHCVVDSVGLVAVDDLIANVDQLFSSPSRDSVFGAVRIFVKSPNNNEIPATLSIHYFLAIRFDLEMLTAYPVMPTELNASPPFSCVVRGVIDLRTVISLYRAVVLKKVVRMTVKMYRVRYYS